MASSRSFDLVASFWRASMTSAVTVSALDLGDAGAGVDPLCPTAGAALQRRQSASRPVSKRRGARRSGGRTSLWVLTWRSFASLSALPRQNSPTRPDAREGTVMRKHNLQCCPPDRRRSVPALPDRGQRFENWKLRRAFLRPYFFRSTMRLSRVRKPPSLRRGCKPGSMACKAREIPSTMAPTCPVVPPP